MKFLTEFLTAKQHSRQVHLLMQYAFVWSSMLVYRIHSIGLIFNRVIIPSFGLSIQSMVKLGKRKGKVSIEVFFFFWQTARRTYQGFYEW